MEPLDYLYVGAGAVSAMICYALYRSFTYVGEKPPVILSTRAQKIVDILKRVDYITDLTIHEIHPDKITIGDLTGAN